MKIHIDKSKNIFYVYGHYKPGNIWPFYIGKGKNRRGYTKGDRNKYWHNIVNKYGYNVEIMYKNLTNEQAVNIEIELIKKYGRIIDNTGCLVNMTIGGENPIGLRGKNSPHFGISKSESTKKLIANSKLGKPSWNKGIPATDEHKLKNRLGHLGQIAHNKGKSKYNIIPINGKYIRNCPICNKEITHTNKYICVIAINNNKLCRGCASKQRIEIYYKNKLKNEYLPFIRG